MTRAGRSREAAPVRDTAIVVAQPRATMLGGTLEVGARPGGGFRVHARLPLETSG